jgi:hypothetical protein
VQTKNGEHIIVRDYVYLTLWKYIKFVTRKWIRLWRVDSTNGDEGGKCCKRRYYSNG